MLTLTDVKQQILKLNTTIKHIQIQRKELREKIEEEKQNLATLSAMPVALEDHIKANDEFIKEQKELLKGNIQNYLKGSQVHNEPTAFQGVRSLHTFLVQFGQRRGVGNQIHLPFVLAIGGDWKKLRELVNDELRKLPSEKWGPYQASQRAKKTRLCRERTRELEHAIEVLGTAGHDIK